MYIRVITSPQTEIIVSTDEVDILRNEEGDIGIMFGTMLHNPLFISKFLYTTFKHL